MSGMKMAVSAAGYPRLDEDDSDNHDGCHDEGDNYKYNYKILLNGSRTDDTNHG